MTDVSTTCAEAIFRRWFQSVANNSPSQDSNHPDDLFQSRFLTPGFQPFFLELTHVSLTEVLLPSVKAEVIHWKWRLPYIRLKSLQTKTENKNRDQYENCFLAFQKLSRI